MSNMENDTIPLDQRRLSRGSRTSRVSHSTMLSQSTINFPYYGDRSILNREAAIREAEQRRHAENRLAEQQLRAAYRQQERQDRLAADRQSQTNAWTTDQAQTFTMPTSTELDMKSHKSEGDVEAEADRLSLVDSVVSGRPACPPKSLLFKQLTAALFLLLILFWGNLCWLMGKIYRQSDYAYRLHVISADFDGGPIGAALTETTEKLSGTHRMLTFETTTGQSVEEILHRVRGGSNIWGAIIANEGASQNLSAVINGEENAEYDPSSAFTLMYNDARYHTAEEAIVFQDMNIVFQETLQAYQKENGQKNIAAVANSTNPAAISAVLAPMAFEEELVPALNFGIAVLLNSVMMVMPVLGQFFCVMFINGILGLAGAYSEWTVKTNQIIRVVVGLAYPCLFAFSWAGWIWIFQNGQGLTAGQYFLSWLTVWMYCIINFQILDAFICVVEMKWAPFMVLTLAITAVASALGPRDLANHFYRIDYIFPAYHTWGILMVIFGKGATNHLDINVTINLLYLIGTTALAFFLNTKQFTRLRSGEATYQAH